MAVDTVRYIEQSNMPTEVKKTAIRSMFEKLTGGAASHAAGYARESMHVVRQYGEGGVIGGLLGFVDAEYGLDIGGKVPLDGLIAAAGAFSSVWLTHDLYGISADMRNAGSQAFAIMFYRKTKEWREAAGRRTAKVHGEDDPILACAADL
jgi:hypothetical protein